MAAARKSKPRARTRKRAKRSSARVPVLEQRHLDLLGLGLVALSAFLAFVLYGGWQGGRAGGGGGEGRGGGDRRGARVADRQDPLPRAGGLRSGRGDPRAAARAAGGAALSLRWRLP